MIISTTRFAGTSGDPLKANIQKQIRRLEKKKVQLMKKLNKSGDTGGTASMDLAKASVSVAAPQASGQSAAAATLPAASGDGSGAQAQAASQVAAAGASRNNEIAQALRELQTSMSSSQSVPELEEDPKDIMKQIQLLDMQIMLLRQQLEDDDGTTVLANLDDEDEDDSQNPLAQFLPQAGGAEAALPTAEVVEGHVDGYA